MSIISTIFPSFSQPKGLSSLSDDTVLRRLAQDYDDGKTKWVFAADMTELFEAIDLHNFCIGDAKNIVVNIDPRIAQNLESFINENSHHYTDEELDSSDVKKLFGPTMVDGFIISFGGKSYNGYYRYNGIESYIDIETREGIKRHQFGMGLNFADILNPTPKFSTLEKTC